MWLLVANGLVYLACNVGSGRLLRKFFPLSPRAVLADVLAAAERPAVACGPAPLQRGATRGLSVRDASTSVLLVLSGLVLWKSVQFPLLRELLGGYEAARRVHFLAMAALVAFVGSSSG